MNIRLHCLMNLLRQIPCKFGRHAWGQWIEFERFDYKTHSCKKCGLRERVAISDPTRRIPL
jgi:hypothetical protein